MRDFVRQEREYDLYHTHGLWVHVNHLTGAEARRKNKPYVMSPHGMLYPQALARSRWKKKLLLFLWFRRDLAGAACVHCTCDEEMRHYRRLGYRNPVAVVPNPVPVPDYVTQWQTDPEIGRSRQAGRRLGFLGRFHPRKRVERLIEAWSRVQEDCGDGELVLIGTGDESYIQSLKALVHRLGLNNVTFTGQLDGQEKFAAVAQLRALFVPSDFENFGMIVPEALMVGTPVMASLGTPWQELETHQCGWWRDNSVDSITEIMRHALAADEQVLYRMGANGIRLVTEKYAENRVAEQMASVYRWILGGGSKPGCVFTD
ncbi:MAG: glycosyltransferase, partial [Lentisphaerae bacterium]|nr:glycosyltransferase [Lentisphaerota bacterium]